MTSEANSRGVRFGHGPAVLLVALALLIVTAGTAWADFGDYRCSDPGRAYFGNPRLIRHPAVISADSVYQSIPEYREILEQGLSDKDVRYHFLMKKASQRFSKAVKAMARSLGHDFVSEAGAVELVRDGAAAPPDRTGEVIGYLG